MVVRFPVHPSNGIHPIRHAAARKFIDAEAFPVDRAQGNQIGYKGAMTISFEDRFAINDLIALHGHLMDSGAFDRLDELFTPDVVYDVSDLGYDALQGYDAFRAASLAVGDSNPIGHHVTNVLVSQDSDGTVRARSKGIGILADGVSGSVVYEDVLVPTAAGWRISYRKVLARRRPLTD